MGGKVRGSRVVPSLTVLLLIKGNRELMMRGGLDREMLLLRLFATLVERRAIRAMLVLEM